MKVGIDLSSSNTGVIILENNNKLVDKGVFNLWKDNKINFDEIVKLSNFIYDAWLAKANCDIEKLETIDIGVELADFKNANYTNRFNRICGALEFDFWEAPYDYECKLFNSNEWQRFLLDIYKPYISVRKEIVGYYDIEKQEPIYKEYYQINYRYKTPLYDFGYIDCIGGREWKSMRIEKNERTLRKALSRLFTEQHCKEYQDTWTEDECDAYCIAYFLPQLRDRTQMHQEVKVRKINKAKSEKQALRDKLSKEKRVNKLKDIVIKYKSMEKLTKAQQIALEKAEMELKEYKK